MKSFKAGIVMVVALVMAALGFMSCSSNSAKLVSITVTPTDPVYASGTQFTATGTFSDGLILNYTSEVIWSSSNPTVATVGMTAGTAGYVTVLSAGITTITAVEPYNNFTSSSLLTIVTPSTITITPENPVMAEGTSYQFAAIALWSEGNRLAKSDVISNADLDFIRFLDCNGFARFRYYRRDNHNYHCKHYRNRYVFHQPNQHDQYILYDSH